MIKIVITGPESTGKSTLAKQLARHYNAPLVKEYAREYLTKLNKKYTQQDLTKIAKGQIELENKAMKSNSKFIVCDTSLEVIKIWSAFKYNSCEAFIIKALQERQPNLYLLMATDLPWQPDALRKNPENRKELYALYKNELTTSKVPFYEISGSGEDRLEMARKAINNLL